MSKYYSSLNPKEFWLSMNFDEVKEYIKNKVKELNLDVKIDSTILMLKTKNEEFTVVVSSNGLTNVVYNETTKDLKDKVENIVLGAFRKQVSNFEFVE